MKNKNIILTGGAGFIGSNIAEKLSMELDDMRKSGRLQKITAEVEAEFLK